MSNKQPTSVRILIDTSTGIAAHQLNEVCQVVRQIITKSPSNAQFDVGCCNSGFKTLFSNQRGVLDVNNLVRDINLNYASASATIALYDGLGQTLNEIPYDSTLGFFRFLVFCDGKDNHSMIYNAPSVINLLTEKLQRNTNMHLTFIQFGPQTAITSALEATSIPKARCSVVVIPSHITGYSLKAFLNSATQALCMELQKLIVPAQQLSPPYYPPRSLPPEPILPHPLGAVPDGRRFVNGGRGVVKAVTKPVAPVIGIPELVSILKAVGIASGQQPAVVQPKPCAPQAQSRGRGRQDRNVCAASTLKQFKVWVGNLPMVGQSEILDFLRQWGPCDIETLNGNPSQWAVVAYSTQQGMEFAVKYGNGSTFKGQSINVNKIS